MTATILPFRRPPAKLRQSTTPDGNERIVGFAISLQVHDNGVCLVAHNVELWLSPEQARELGADLVDLADDAEAAK